MDDTRFYRKPWFYIVAWRAILLIAYGWQIRQMGGIRANLFDVFVDLACVFLSCSSCGWLSLQEMLNGQTIEVDPNKERARIRGKFAECAKDTNAGCMKAMSTPFGVKSDAYRCY